MLDWFNLEKIYKYLLIALAFLMPLTVFGANLVIVAIVLFWFFSGDFNFKYRQIISSKLLIASIIFFCLHVIGLLWTEDILWGLEIVHKMWYFLVLLPVLFTIVKKEYIRNIILAFLLAIAFTELISYLIWFELIPPIKNATVINPTPFMSHISYNPILCFAIYLVGHEVFLNKNLSRLQFYLYSFFAIAMTVNMFITGGRSGQVMFFAAITILVFQYFHKAKIKALMAICILLPGIFFSAYQSSDLFKLRFDSAIEDVIKYERGLRLTNHQQHKDFTLDLSYINTPVGERLTYAIYSWRIIKRNPIIGIGTGDFPSEYKKINSVYSSRMINTTHPHNMYNLILVQLGVVGFISLMSIFYYQIKIAVNSSNQFMRNIGLALPLLFLIIMLADSYLLGHYTTLMFVLFSSFLYKDFDKP